MFFILWKTKRQVRCTWEDTRSFLNSYRRECKAGCRGGAEMRRTRTSPSNIVRPEFVSTKNKRQWAFRQMRTTVQNCILISLRMSKLFPSILPPIIKVYLWNSLKAVFNTLLNSPEGGLGILQLPFRRFCTWHRRLPAFSWFYRF